MAVTDVQHVVAPSARTTGRARAGTTGLLLAMFALVVIGPIVADDTAQPASRFVTTASYAEHGSVDLTRYSRVLGIDVARYGHELRSDKAPGQPFLAVPFYVIGRALGFHSASEHRVHGNLSLWWQTLWGAMVPFAALLVLMWDRARRQAPTGALPAVLALGFGTLMLPHAANLYGHALAALAAFGAWIVFDRGRGGVRSLCTAGFLVGLAVSVEYHTAIIGVVVAVVAAMRWRGRAWWLAIGAAVPLAMTALYQQVAFGRPWHLAYAYLTTTSNDGHYGIPTPAQLADIVAGAHGLLLTSPVILVAVGAAIVVARAGRGVARTDAWVGLAVFTPYFLLVAGWTGTPLLEQPGPRYLIPALPFLAAPLAAMWARFRPVAIITTLWGAAVMVAGSVTMHLVRPHDQPFHVYFSNVLDRRFNPTLWSIVFGDAGVLIYLGTIAVVGMALWGAHRRLVGDAP